ncbi:hypothetical protein SAMN04488057_102227 [Cyclobacterium lianum]|uniref:Uncharacterized protein n=1 Tax=Cyclobacterium lianum TaxID=388280 RepID=A0A1M7JZQ6_9BACT|nr:hypothetical protein [Cyclobacterium lianum]SHM58444.1 hypothetical protein SAMN04488057_102227 [Cyclobacterium lianum]
MKSLFLSLFALLLFSQTEAQQIPSKAMQIKTAVLAAPEDLREGAMVYGYDSGGNWTVLRAGSNEMVCIADDPKAEGFNVACYHKQLEPFMERGRELKKEGKNFQEIFDTRENEVRAGSLKMPKDGATLYSLTAAAEDYDAMAGEVKNSYLRYVVYIPWATQESTGLALKPEAPGMPWIMDPGTHRAHIMINPPKE